MIVHNLGWPALFSLAAAFGAFLLVLDGILLRKVEWREGDFKGFDRLGPLIYAPALFAFLLGMSWLPQTQRHRPYVAGSRRGRFVPCGGSRERPRP